MKIVKEIGKDINMNFVLKIVQTFDNNIAYCVSTVHFMQ
jgi:hypothetical protein